MTNLKFNKDFVFGVGTSEAQIEEPGNGSWKGIVAEDGSKNNHGVKHLENWKYDLSKIVELGVDYYKTSISWPRIMPEDGKINEEAIKKYHEMFSYLKNNGVKLNLVLHHFNNPNWLDKKGGWINPESIGKFKEFSKLAMSEFNTYTDLVSTINEISTYTSLAYLDGILPNNNGHRFAPVKLAKAKKNMVAAHKQVYNDLKERYPSMQIGFTEGARPFKTYHETGLKNIIENRMKTIIENGLKENYKMLAHHTDFVGAQYYGPFYISAEKILEKEPFQIREDLPHDDLWNLDEKMLMQEINAIQEIMPGKPIIITENGVSTENDSLRIESMKKILGEIAKNQDAIKGYFHWSLLDNFELSKGYSKRFGLIHVDYDDDFKRTPKESFYSYKNIVQESRK